MTYHSWSSHKKLRQMSEQASFNRPWCVDEYQSVRNRSFQNRCSQLKNRSSTQRYVARALQCTVLRFADFGWLERARKSSRRSSLSYARSTYSSWGRCFGRPVFPATGGIASTTSSNSLTSGTLAAVTVADNGMPCASTTAWCLLPFFPRSVGLGPVSSPPPSARANELSTAARDQSIWSASRSSFRSTWCRWSQMPNACHSCNRLRQALPEPQPISQGKSFQRMPVRRTNRMPVSAWRLVSGLRPGKRKRLGLGEGKSGSMRCHRASDNKGAAMIVPPVKYTEGNNASPVPNLFHSATVSKKLEGKIHLYCGTGDNFFLNNAVYLVEDILKNTKDPYYGGEVDYGDRAEHCWNGDHTRPNAI